MKLLSILIGAILLASCSHMGSSGASGTSGASNSDENKPYSQRPFNPDDPYHGG